MNIETLLWHYVALNKYKLLQQKRFLTWIDFHKLNKEFTFFEDENSLKND